ncbi:leucine-rich repeat, cysteine-containing subtype protein, partial [Tanacetum coccineum]
SREVFKHARKLDHFGYGIIDEDSDYNGFEFPPNILGLHIQDLYEASFPFLLLYLNQLRELDLLYEDHTHNCQCFFFERCPNLEVLVTEDICGDIGLQVVGQFCKKLRKLTHYGRATHIGLITLAQGCPNLEYLAVTLLDISNEALECVGTHLKNLRDFRTYSDGEVSITSDLSPDNGVRAMLMGCIKLERLRICFGGLTDIGLGYIGKYGHNLRDLSLINTGESNVELLDLSKGSPK